MTQFLAVLDRQMFYGKPINRWGPGKTFPFLIQAETKRQAVDICLKQCMVFNSQLPPGHRFVVGPIRPDPSQEAIVRAKPQPLADPLPDVPLPHLPHAFSYIDLDDESRFHPGNKAGSGMRVIVLLNEDNGEASYTSAANGSLYRTKGADKLHTIKPERLDMISLSFPFCPMMPAFDEHGQIDYAATVPDLTCLPLTREWLERQVRKA